MRHLRESFKNAGDFLKYSVHSKSMYWLKNGGWVKKNNSHIPLIFKNLNFSDRSGLYPIKSSKVNMVYIFSNSILYLFSEHSLVVVVVVEVVVVQSTILHVNHLLSSKSDNTSYFKLTDLRMEILHIFNCNLFSIRQTYLVVVFVVKLFTFTEKKSSKR